jgi:hypothetical protein
VRKTVAIELPPRWRSGLASGDLIARHVDRRWLRRKGLDPPGIETLGGCVRAGHEDDVGRFDIVGDEGLQKVGMRRVDQRGLPRQSAAAMNTGGLKPATLPSIDTQTTSPRPAS